MKAFKFLLGPSWARLRPFWGRSWGQKSLKFSGFYKVSVNIAFLKKIRLGMASWMDLGSISAPKGVLKGSQLGPKTDQKSIQKYDGFLDRF